jgi:hypothetical protein
MLFVELKHYKDDKRRFSTLAWAAVPLDKLVDVGPSTARVSGLCSVTVSVYLKALDRSAQHSFPTCLLLLQVRGGPLDLPLLKKPVDASLRKVRRLSRTFDLHLSIRGVE